jgi:hypothetical protein
MKVDIFWWTKKRFNPIIYSKPSNNKKWRISLNVDGRMQKPKWKKN